MRLKGCLGAFNTRFSLFCTAFNAPDALLTPKNTELKYICNLIQWFRFT